jgi:hypothetical protein
MGVGDGREAARAFGFCRAGCWRHSHSFYAGRRYWGCSGAPFCGLSGRQRSAMREWEFAVLQVSEEGVFEDLAVGESA